MTISFHNTNDNNIFIKKTFRNKNIADVIDYRYSEIFLECVFINCIYETVSPSSPYFIRCTFINCKFNYSPNDTFIFFTCSFGDMAISCIGHAGYPKYLKCAFNGVNFEDGDDAHRLNNVFSDCDYMLCSGYIPFKSRCPVEGSFIAYKQIISPDGQIDGQDVWSIYVAKLLIPEDAKRLSAGGSKCRASKAIVLDILNLDGTPVDNKKLQTRTFISVHDRNFKYEKGSVVRPRYGFDPDQWKECSDGIHFFMTFEEAASYRF